VQVNYILDIKQIHTMSDLCHSDNILHFSILMVLLNRTFNLADDSVVHDFCDISLHDSFSFVVKHLVCYLNRVVVVFETLCETCIYCLSAFIIPVLSQCLHFV
jgi:hypothetical protein